MDVAIIDVITAAFLGALETGTAALAQFSLPLLGVFAVISFYLQFGALVASGGGQVGDALATLLLTAIKLGFFVWLLINLSPLATAAFDTFLQWGVTPTGGGISAATFRNPSTVMLVGFRIGGPIREFTNSWVSWAAVWNWPLLLTYSLAFYAILLSFTFIALNLMICLVEFNLAVMVATVLIPWGVLQPTAFFSEFSLSWVTGGLVRIFVTTAMVGIAVPLFDLVRFNTTGGGDPTFYSAIVVGLTSVIFAILSWIAPARAAAIAGRGVSLALHAGTLTAGAASGARGVITVSNAVRGVSQLVRR